MNRTSSPAYKGTPLIEPTVIEQLRRFRINDDGSVVSVEASETLSLNESENKINTSERDKKNNELSWKRFHLLWALGVTTRLFKTRRISSAATNIIEGEKVEDDDEQLVIDEEEIPTDDLVDERQPSALALIDELIDYFGASELPYENETWSLAETESFGETLVEIATELFRPEDRHICHALLVEYADQFWSEDVRLVMGAAIDATAQYKQRLLHLNSGAARFSFGAGHSITEKQWLAGLLGLLRGIERFDPSRSTKIMTFAGSHIRQRRQRLRQNHSRPVRVPVHQLDKDRGTYLNRRRELATALREHVETAKPAAAMQKTRIHGYQRPLHRGATILLSTSKLAALHSIDMRCSILELLKTDLLHAIELFAHHSRERDQARLQDILLKRFGIERHSPKLMTLEQVGEDYNVTRERIRQIQQKASEGLFNQLKQSETAGLIKAFSSSNEVQI